MFVEDEVGGLKLVTVNENKHVGFAPAVCHDILKSRWFRLLMMGTILANGIVMATMNFEHDGRPRQYFYEKYYYIEVNTAAFLLPILSPRWYINVNFYVRRLFSRSSSIWKRYLKCGVSGSKVTSNILIINLN